MFLARIDGFFMRMNTKSSELIDISFKKVYKIKVNRKDEEKDMDA